MKTIIFSVFLISKFTVCSGKFLNRYRSKRQQAKEQDINISVSTAYASKWDITNVRFLI